MPDLSDLISRVEKASGPDREIDGEIAAALNVYPDGWRRGVKEAAADAIWFDDRIGCNWHAPAYTASIDAALTLLPEGFWWRGGTCSVSSEATVCPDHNGTHRERLLRECPPTELIWDEGIETELRPGSNNALIRALLSAILRAKQAMQMEASS